MIDEGGSGSGTADRAAPSPSPVTTRQATTPWPPRARVVNNGDGTAPGRPTPHAAPQYTVLLAGHTGLYKIYMGTYEAPFDRMSANGTPVYRMKRATGRSDDGGGSANGSRGGGSGGSDGSDAPAPISYLYRNDQSLWTVTNAWSKNPMSDIANNEVRSTRQTPRAYPYAHVCPRPRPRPHPRLRTLALTLACTLAHAHARARARTDPPGHAHAPAGRDPIINPTSGVPVGRRRRRSWIMALCRDIISVFWGCQLRLTGQEGFGKGSRRRRAGGRRRG